MLHMRVAEKVTGVTPLPGRDVGVDGRPSGQRGGQVAPERGAVVLVDLQGVDLPERIPERARVVLDEGLARLSGAGAVAVDGARPVAAEGGVEDEVVLPELSVPVAARARPPGGRSAPVARVGAVREHVSGCRASRPEPDRDAGGVPLHGVDSSACCVEAGAVGAVVVVFEATADVAVDVCVAVLACGIEEGAGGG